MPSTRSQTRRSNSPPKELAIANGKLTATAATAENTTATKRKADTEPKPVSKTSKKSKDEDVHEHKSGEEKTKDEKEETVVNELVEKKVDGHETVPVEGDPQKDEVPKSPDVAMTDEQERSNENDNSGKKEEKNGNTESDDKKNGSKNTKDTPSEDQTPSGAEGNKEENGTENAVVIDKETKSKDKDSSILEKGIIYFFYRPRVNVEDPQSLNDVQRSYIILRPLPIGASLKSNSLEDEGNNRLLAIPKKKFPSTGKHEKFLTFVDKAKTTIADLKDSVLKSSTYQTKTMGERTNPAARPVGEGVYAVISNAQDRQSHLAYILTYPEKPDELQKEFGLQEKGSFAISVRNPKTPAPANVAVKTPAEFPEEIMKEFNGLRWSAAEPKHLDYENAEILFIGEAKELQPDGDADKAALEQLETLEDEDLERVRHLEGDHTIFEDLTLSKKEYDGVKGTWNE